MTDEEDELDEHLQTAREAHAQIDALKRWALRQEADLRARAEYDEDADDRRCIEIADEIRKVYERIEEGDLSRVRNG